MHMQECVWTRHGGETVRERERNGQASVGQRTRKPGERRSRKLTKCCAVHGAETGRVKREKSVSMLMHHLVAVCHLCSSSAMLMVALDKREHTSVLVKSQVCACVTALMRLYAHVYLRNSSMLALEAPRRFEAKQV